MPDSSIDIQSFGSDSLSNGSTMRGACSVGSTQSSMAIHKNCIAGVSLGCSILPVAAGSDVLVDSPFNSNPCVERSVGPVFPDLGSSAALLGSVDNSLSAGAFGDNRNGSIADTVNADFAALRGQLLVEHISNIIECYRDSASSLVPYTEVCDHILQILVESRVDLAGIDLSCGTYNLPALCGGIIFTNPRQHAFKAKAFEKLVLQNSVMCFQESHCDQLDFEQLRNLWNGFHVLHGSYSEENRNAGGLITSLDRRLLSKFHTHFPQILLKVGRWRLFW